MDKQHYSRAPLIVAIVLLFLPVLYVGSYLVLVDPGDFDKAIDRGLEGRSMHYRMGGRWIGSFYWPLEQIDRKIRPKAWPPGL